MPWRTSTTGRERRGGRDSDLLRCRSGGSGDVGESFQQSAEGGLALVDGGALLQAIGFQTRVEGYGLDATGVKLTDRAAIDVGGRGRTTYSANGKAHGLGAAIGFGKVISDAKYGELLGAHLIGPEVTELLPELTLAGPPVGPEGPRGRAERPRPPDVGRGGQGGCPRPGGAT